MRNSPYQAEADYQRAFMREQMALLSAKPLKVKPSPVAVLRPPTSIVWR